MNINDIWNGLLTLGLGLISWFAKEVWSEMQRLQTQLSQTREELAKEYVTKAEVHTDINRVMSRLETIDAKFDRLIERMNKS